MKMGRLLGLLGLLGIGVGLFFLGLGRLGAARSAVLGPASQVALAQTAALTHTVYLPLVLVPEPPPPPLCEPPLSKMGLQLADLPPGFTLEFEAAGRDLLAAEVRAMGAVDVCSMGYASFMWLFLGEMGVVGSMVIEFDNVAGPGQYLALVRAQALADPAMTVLGDVVGLGEEMAATRTEIEGGLAVYALTFRWGRFVGRVAGGGLVDVGAGALVGYGEVVEGRLW